MTQALAVYTRLEGSLAVCRPCQAWIPFWGGGRPGSLGPGGGQVWGFCFPIPRLLTTCEFRRASESASKRSNGLSRLDSLPFSEVRGYLPLFPCQCPAARVQRGGGVISPRSQSQFWGRANRPPPCPPSASAVWVTFPLLECQPGCAVS